MNSDGTRDVRVTQNIAWTTSGLWSDKLKNMNLTSRKPIFSPDGKNIAFTQESSIYMLDMRGANFYLKRLTMGNAVRWM